MPLSTQLSYLSTFYRSNEAEYPRHFGKQVIAETIGYWEYLLLMKGKTIYWDVTLILSRMGQAELCCRSINESLCHIEH